MGKKINAGKQAAPLNGVRHAKEKESVKRDEGVKGVVQES